MQVYKTILQRPNEMVKVLVKRENGDLKRTDAVYSKDPLTPPAFYSRIRTFAA